jgi:hypothetical protein
MLSASRDRIAGQLVHPDARLDENLSARRDKREIVMNAANFYS